MNKVEVKTADLIGPALDWAVAIIDGVDPYISGREIDGHFSTRREYIGWSDGAPYSPHELWAQCGPLIDKYGLGVVKFYEPVDGPIAVGYEWAALWRDDSVRMDGPTPLIAACRAMVASELGDTVMVPAELLEAA